MSWTVCSDLDDRITLATTSECWLLLIVSLWIAMHKIRYKQGVFLYNVMVL